MASIEQAQLALEKGEHETALQLAKEILSSEPGNLKASVVAANSAMITGQFQEAIVHLLSLLKAQPNNASLRNNLSTCHNNLGKTALSQGNTELADEEFKKALGANPANPVALHNYALLMKKTGKIPEALAYFDACLKQQESLTTRMEFIHTLADSGRIAMAEQAAAKLDTDAAADDNDRKDLAELYLKLGRHDKARALLKSINTAADNWRGLCKASLSLLPVPLSIEELQNERETYSHGLDWLQEQASGPVALDDLVWANFFLAYQGMNDLELQTRFGDILANQLEKVPAPEPPKRERPLLVMVSSFFRQCTVGAYFNSWISALRSEFEVHLIQLGPLHDDWTNQMASFADQFELLDRCSEVRDRLLALKPDIVLYPELGMDARLPALAALKLAPLQCCAWGHPETTGLASIDYFISCESMEPENAAAHYREKLLLLPGLGTTYQAADPGTAGKRADYQLPEDANVYLMPQSLFKVHPDNDALWADILSRDEKGKFLIFADRNPVMTERFTRRFADQLRARGLDPKDRVLVLPEMNRADFLKVISVCDVVLDTLHYSGGNTSLDALSCGLPIISMPGEMMRARQTAAMLNMLSVDELIAESTGQYVEIACELAANKEKRGKISQQILINQTALFGDTKPVQVLADKLFKLWLEHQS